ncbi:hypothetical protein H5410_019752 [Solanum commersonii]|uniref:Uncharacterized protein n=1 Tax=Solanum commersonii TaxID=4109 RepID=A0A9J5Z983_SOLCO|nr:hypothetical protein H5410_019752 [Solanum commersonii]
MEEEEEEEDEEEEEEEEDEEEEEKKKFIVNGEVLSSSIAQNQPNGEENANHLEVPSHSSQEFDLSSLKANPGERTQILEFHPNHRDAIRRAYLQKKNLVNLY